MSMTSLKLSTLASCFAVFFTMAIGCSDSVKIPAAYVPFNLKDGTFACQAPEGWNNKGGGGKSGSPAWAKFESGPALVEIKASAAGSLMSDAMGGNMADATAPVPELAPVHLIHVAAIRDAEKKFKEYAETAASPVEIECQLGPARISEFTAKSSFGTALHGYRGTIIGHERGVTIYCSSPESDWQTLKPTFDKIFATLEPGTPE
jgi:hypothetical protein